MHTLSTAIFIRLLGLSYLIAFASLATQVLGLIGSNGILPAEPYLEFIAQRAGDGRYYYAPSIFWLDASDASLQLACVAGIIGSLLLMTGVLQAPMALLLWGLYLSLAVVGQRFTGYQWDALLLEVGLLTALLAPWNLRPRLAATHAPNPVVRWALLFLLFKLMFSSGVVKLLSGDPTWRALTAMSYHYETQPIPNLFAYYVHQLPAWFHMLSCIAMFAVELIVPLLIVFRGKSRRIAAFSLIGLQVIIALTGNYTFFNLLSAALCLLLLEDDELRRFVPARLQHHFDKQPASTPWQRHILPAIVAIPIFLLSACQLALTCFGARAVPHIALQAVDYAQPLRSINRYGLFAVMTTERPEIIIEGSNDGTNWRTYEFKWKAGDLARSPGQVAPHQPRLDWQMWFAALRRFEQVLWFRNFLQRLLEGEESVLALLESNPFPDAPPRFIRALSYDYRFTNLAEKAENGHWWKRQLTGAYAPIMHLSSSKNTH